MGRRMCLTDGSVIAFLAFDFLAPAFPFYEGVWCKMAVSAVLIGQVNLIATWGAFVSVLAFSSRKTLDQS